MGGRVSILVLTGGETGGRENSTEFITIVLGRENRQEDGGPVRGGGRRNSKQLMFTEGSRVPGVCVTAPSRACKGLKASPPMNEETEL